MNISVLPVRATRRTSPRDDLAGFELRDDDLNERRGYLLNVDSAYGPLVHAVQDNHHLVHVAGLPRLTRADVEQLWANEVVLRQAGLTTVGFCERCVLRFAPLVAAS